MKAGIRHCRSADAIVDAIVDAKPCATLDLKSYSFFEATAESKGSKWFAALTHFFLK
jgi:hypothetical protein